MKFKWKHNKTDYNKKTPVRIKIDGKYASCQREIAKKYMAHIKDKIEKLTNEKPNKTDDAINFRKLIKKNKDTFTFREVK